MVFPLRADVATGSASLRGTVISASAAASSRGATSSLGNALRALSVLALAVPLVLCSCAPHMAEMSLVRRDMSRGDYQAALNLLGKGDEDNLLYLLERGLLCHYAGLFDESNEVFERAEILAEDLYTKSISREVASLFTSDIVLEYSGTDMERVMINYYRALNYIHLGLPDDALVECRKINEKLALYTEKHRDDRSYYDDPFLQYITGLLFEWGGEFNDAYISYEAADRLYPHFSETYGVDPPQALPCDTERTGEMLGFLSPGDAGGTPCAHSSGHGEVVLLLELGFVAHKDEDVLHIPVFEDEQELAESHDEDFCTLLAERAGGYDARGREIAYLLSIAVPHYVYDEPEVQFGRLTAGRHRAGDIHIETRKVQDLSAIAVQDLREAMPRILAKTAARALAKYLAKRGAEREWGRAAGLAADIFGSATEHADTRSWLSLPSEMQIARLSLPAGAYSVSLELIDWGGSPAQDVDFGEIEVNEGEIAFLQYRAP